MKTHFIILIIFLKTVSSWRSGLRQFYVNQQNSQVFPFARRLTIHLCYLDVRILKYVNIAKTVRLRPRRVLTRLVWRNVVDGQKWRTNLERGKGAIWHLQELNTTCEKGLYEDWIRVENIAIIFESGSKYLTK